MNEPSSDVVQRRIGAPLAVGIVLLPGFFVWFLLRSGHSTLARALGFGWAGLILTTSLAIVSSSSERDSKEVPLQGVQAQESRIEGAEQARICGSIDGADCAKVADFEIDAVTLCRTMVEDSLVSASSFETVGPWQFVHSGTVGTVRQKYSATNGFGAHIDASFRCKYDADAKAIIALEIVGPFGRQVIVSNEMSETDYLTAEQRAEGQKRMMEGAARASASRDVDQPAGSKPVRWTTNFLMAGCPQASDWFAMQDAVMRDDMSVDLPKRCIEIEPGTMIVTPAKGQRETVNYKGHVYEKAWLEDGRVFWTDAMHSSSLTPR